MELHLVPRDLLLIEKMKSEKTKLQRSELSIDPINIEFANLFIIFRGQQ